MGVNFVGLFDTVASSVEVGRKDLALDPAFARKVVQFVAADEFRDAFPVQSIMNPRAKPPDNFSEYFMRGAHSTVGLGYRDDEQGKSIALGIEYMQLMATFAERAGAPKFDFKGEDSTSSIKQGLSEAEFVRRYIHESRWLPGIAGRRIIYPITGDKEL